MPTTEQRSSPVPKYQMVRQQLVEAITKGLYPIGSPFPTEAQLVDKYNVSRPTIVRSLQELVRDGYLLRHQGRGTVVADYRASQSPTRIPLFVNAFAVHLSGAARQVLLRLTRGIEEGLGARRELLSFHQVPQEKLDEPTRRLIDQLDSPIALIVESDFNKELVAALREKGCRTITLNQPEADHCSVYIDQEQSGYIATQHLIASGRRRIALLNGPVDAYWGFGARQNGYLRALNEAGIAVDETLMCQGADPIDSEAGRTMMRRLLDERVELDGVVGVSDSKAMGAMRTTQEAGLSIPNDVMFVAIDDTIADQATPALSAVRMPFEDVGRQAAAQAMRLLDESDSKHIAASVCLKPELVVR